MMNAISKVSLQFEYQLQKEMGERVVREVLNGESDDGGSKFTIRSLMRLITIDGAVLKLVTWCI